MSCINCTIKPSTFQVRFQEKEHLLHMIAKHIQRMGFPAIINEEGHLYIEEEAMNEVVSFCEDFSELSKIQFANDQRWLSLKEIKTLLAASWVEQIIKEKRIICYSQAIITRNEEIYGHEVLARFISVDGKLLSPGEVFAAAKIRGKLYALDRTCRLAAVQYAERLPNKVFINFLPTSIYSPEFCLRSTVALANRLNIKPDRFVFEVVETEEVKDTDHLKHILNYYQEKGFRYALDDVGEGFSTADLLADITPHYMKLDRQFVEGIANDTDKQQAARFYLDKARSIGSIPLAEGIEKRDDYLFLKEMGYELFQGFYFSRPQAEPVIQLDWSLL
ncbi:EAL domain-containing protein [Lysinibacillus sp. 3P01SB]|uniref:EAL domain-containing protein n=1 Tax=Lysinibacillus sp. 3P01SB TaxID=3132284 RepID=UPI0039A63EE7